MMATADTRARAHFTYIWTIENVSKLTQLLIKSPSFVANSVSKVEWYLEIVENIFTEDMCCSLKSEDPRKEPPSAIDTEFSFLGADGSPLLSKGSDKYSFRISLMTIDVFMDRLGEFISNNTLTVRFRMWRRRRIIKTPDFCCVRTKLQTYRRAFLWPIEEFRALKRTSVKNFMRLALEERKIYPLKNLTPVGRFMALILYLKGNSQSGNVCVDFLIEEGEDYGYKCEISVVDANGEVIGSELQGVQTRSWRSCLEFRNLISKNKLLSNKNLFLPNNTLLLRCSFEICTGVITSEIEYCSPNVSLVVKETEVPTVKVTAMSNDFKQFEENSIIDTDKNISDDNLVVAKSYSDSCKMPCPLKAALKYLHNEEILSDISLRIGTKLYPVHRNILSSRSPVFRTIFSKDIKENIFDIHDIDENILSRLLKYIYTDSVEDLHCEVALNLLKAADDYQLLDLKYKCSVILHSADKWEDQNLEAAADINSGLMKEIKD